MARRNEDRVAAGFRGPSADDSFARHGARGGANSQHGFGQPCPCRVRGRAGGERRHRAVRRHGPARGFLSGLGREGLGGDFDAFGHAIPAGRTRRLPRLPRAAGQNPAGQSAVAGPARTPSRLRPDVDGTNPFSYPRLVQPVLDQHCVCCHQRRPARRPPWEERRWCLRAGSRPPIMRLYLEPRREYGFFTTTVPAP